MNKQALYNKIMEKVAVTVKKAINEALEQVDAEMEAINERITGQPGGFGI